MSVCCYSEDLQQLVGMEPGKGKHVHDELAKVAKEHAIWFLNYVTF